jgi:Calcineurin-like phosphoesterase
VTGFRTLLRWRVVASLCALGLLAAVLLPSAAPAAGTVDEIHYTFTSATSVAFDWRGEANDIRYGPTAAYGTTVAGHQPTPPPFSSPGPFWEAELTGLAPGTSYHYSIGGGPDMVFSTAPTGNFRFASIADVGASSSYPQVAVVQSQIAADDPAFVLVSGDISYGNDHGQEVVDQHFNDVMAWSRRAAYMPSWGNHEWDDENFDDLRNYKGRFALPNPQTSPFSPFAGCCGEDWSWFDAGGVRFISYPEPFTGAWSDWRTKADAVMAASQGDPGIHFIVTMGHRPAYSTGNHPGSGTLAGMLDALGDKYPKYLLNINGHTHSYERFAPIHGVTHITAAGGGATLQPPWKTTDPRTAYRAMHHAYLRVDVTAASMRIAAICGPPTPEDDITCTLGEVIDSATINGPGGGVVAGGDRGCGGQQ